MPRVFSDASSLVHELSDARVIQGLLVLIVSITIMALYIRETDVPTQLSSVWLVLVGLYLELPTRNRVGAGVSE